MSAAPRDRHITSLCIVAGLLGVAVVLVTTHRGGPGLSPDSATYLSAAARLVESQQFEGYVSGDEMSAFAPLYPLLLTPGEALGMPVQGARLLGALAYGLLVAAGVAGAARVARGLALPVLMGAFLLLAVPVVGVASFAWSDVPFSLVVSLFLIAASRIGKHRHGVVAVGALAAVAILLRYTGVTVLPVGVAAILLWSRARGRDTLVFLALATVPPALWVARNEIVSSTPAGHRHGSSAGPGAASVDTLRTLGSWLDPDAPKVGLALALVLLAAALVTAIRRRPSELEILSGAFVCAYLATIVASEATVALDPVDDRLLVPVFVPLGWLFVGSFDRLGSIASSRRHLGLAALALAAAMAAWGWMEASRYPALVESVRSASIARLPAWTPGDERRALAISRHVYTNAPDVIFLRTGTRSRFTPHARAYRSDEPVNELGPFRKQLAEDGGGVLVWFEGVHRGSLFTPLELSRWIDIERMESTEATSLYRLTPRPLARSSLTA